MNHRTNRRFWQTYRELPREVRSLARKNYRLLLREPRHPSLHFKKIGRRWAVRVGLDYRAVALEVDDGLLWYWIGPHDEYERLIK